MEISPLGSNHSLPVFQQDYFNGSQRSPSEAKSFLLVLASHIENHYGAKVSSLDWYKWGFLA
ncbi:hypothetical protein N0Y54_04480 [Nostoc punctiforme UO1]|uniref:hypothetical protein n=1 Tax=Nostoc punctiforme TaxID=272131 RepID=UPI0030B21977